MDANTASMEAGDCAGTSPFDKLPDDVLVLVLSKLAPADYSRVRLVSWRFLQALEQSPLELTISTGWPEAASVVQVLHA